MTNMNANECQFLPEIRKGRLKSLKIYEISENELSILAQGSPNSNNLNFAIGLISLSVSFLIALITTEIKSDRVYIVFVVITILGFLLSAYFFLLYRRSNISINKLIEEIKNRMPPEGESEIMKQNIN